MPAPPVASSETVRVVCRFRPPREQLLKGGTNGPAAGAATGAKPSSATPQPSSDSAFKLDYAPDGKSIAFTPTVAVSGLRGREQHRLAIEDKEADKNGDITIRALACSPLTLAVTVTVAASCV